MSDEMADAQKEAFVAKLRRQVGNTGTPATARDPVNQPVIRHWCDAMEDANPLYVNPHSADAGPHGEIVAPPARPAKKSSSPGGENAGRSSSSHHTGATAFDGE